MLLLRKGGQFTDRQISKYLLTAVVCFVLAILSVGAIRYIQIPGVGFLAVVFAIGAFKANFRRWGNWHVGKRGELAVTECLRSLSDDYVVLNDLTFPNGNGNVDHLVIGPNGIFVLETKNYAGLVKCRGDEWYVNGRRVKSLSRQAKSNAMTVRSNLVEVFWDHATKLPFVVAVLVFVNPRGGLHLNTPAIPVLRSRELADFIHNYGSGPNKDAAGTRLSCFSPELKRAMVDHLHTLQRLAA
jgi:hypothetical protein